MTGDAKRRYCGHCKLHVHNLSAMPASEREQFVTESRGRQCITYELWADGSMVTPSRFQRLQRVGVSIAAVLALLLPFFFSSCATRRTMGAPMPLPATNK